MENQKIMVGGHTEVTLLSVGSLERREDCSENRLYSDVTFVTPARAQKVIATREQILTRKVGLGMILAHMNWSENGHTFTS